MMCVSFSYRSAKTELLAVVKAHGLKSNNDFLNSLLSTGVSYKSKRNDLTVYIGSLLIHFEHLPAPTYLGCALGRNLLADFLFNEFLWSIFGEKAKANKGKGGCKSDGSVFALPRRLLQ